MPLILPKSVFLMIPRTGSTWARDAIRNSMEHGFNLREFGPKHSPVLPQNHPKFVFSFTREPRAWLVSRHKLGKWNDELSAFWSENPTEFFSKVTDDMVQMYFNKYTSQCNVIGKQESLADDLVAALKAAGETFDEALLRATKRR